MTKHLRAFALTFVAGVLAFASAANAAWRVVDPAVPVTTKSGGFAVSLPADWNYDTANLAVITSHDGVFLNAIWVGLRPAKEAFKAIKKPFNADALPEELAEAYLATIQAERNASDFQLLSTEPAELAGRPAFRVHFVSRMSAQMGGALIEQVAVGAALPAGLLIATYYAPQIHYFPIWLQTFDETLRKISLVETK
jgi:hypothetical protein